ncbi:MAG TPA: PfkB family carbohydrate kinase [Gaiellaceae bacterium]|nr:PfkB family carbohydrate kinase [Gaiellaceae bacterium]
MSLVAVVGNLARDRIDGGLPQPGGCPFFAALAFRMLGREGRIVTRRAEADGELFDGPVEALRHPVTVLSAAETSGFDHTYDGETRTTTVTAVGDSWEPGVVGLLDDDVSWVHAAPLLRSDFPPETLEAIARSGRRLSLDGQGLVRAPRLGLLEQNAHFEPAILAPLSVLKLSEEEAAIVAGGEFDRVAADSLGVPEILVTLGSRGEDVWLEGDVTHLPTTPVLGVETTGAGDAFMVGYAVARTDGASPVEAARSASRLVGSMLAERKGAVPA